jgi:hypothetical protein
MIKIRFPTSKFLLILKKAAKIIGNLAILAIVAGVVYLVFIHSWHLRWGASDDEVHQLLPGDDLIAEPNYQCTRAVTILAPAEDIWPWLVQIGQDRGGFYSYNWIENLFGLDIHNVYQIVPEWQHLEKGDMVRLSPLYPMEVVVMEEARAIVYKLPPNGRIKQTTWAFVLHPLNSQTTRLIVRMRLNTVGAPITTLILFDPGHFIMERKMMLGIKEVAEASRGIAAGHHFSEWVWFLCLITAALSILGLLFSRRWPWTLAAASVGVSLWVLVLFRGYPSPVYGAFLAIGLLWTLLWAYWPTQPSQDHK